MTDFDISAEDLSVYPNNGRSIQLGFKAEDSDVLEHFDLNDIVNHFGTGAILDHIGVVEVKSHFDLTYKETNLD